MPGKMESRSVIFSVLAVRSSPSLSLQLRFYRRLQLTFQLGVLPVMYEYYCECQPLNLDFLSIIHNLKNKSGTRDLQCSWDRNRKTEPTSTLFLLHVNHALLYPVALRNLKAAKRKKEKVNA
jgi:predicted component of viral defense system (DUF524 family)